MQLITGRVETLLFLWYNIYNYHFNMEKAKLKEIISDLERVLESLKSEVYADATSYMDSTKYEEIKKSIEDYDEVFEDDDGYPD